MRTAIALTIFRKEVLDTVRDRRTLIMMLGVPIVLYPALILVGMQVAMLQVRSAEAGDTRIALQGEDTAPVRAWLENVEKVTIVDADAPEDALRNGDIEAILVVPADVQATLDAGKQVSLELRYDSTELPSGSGVDRVLGGLEEVEKRVQDERLAKLSLERPYIEPLDVTVEDTATPEKQSGTILGMVLPMLMVVMIALGAFYPAVDLTAGEKERGTFESLLSTPASKFEIVAGKFLTVFLLSMISGLLNLLSMGITMGFTVSQIQAVGEGVLPEAFHLPVRAFFLIFLVVTPLGLFISSVMMSMAVFARSFKEAQNYVSPIFILLMLPAMAAGIPGVKLTALGQFVPIYNVTLLFKALMTDQAGLQNVFAVFLSTSAYAVLGILFAAWVFQREDVVLSEERGIPLTLRRSLIPRRSVLSPGMSLSLFVLVMLMLFYVAIPIQQWNLSAGLLITEFLLILLPAVLLPWYVRADLRATLHWRRPSMTSLASAVLLALSAMVVVLKLGESVLPMPEEMAEQAAGLFEAGEGWLDLLWLVFLIGIVPAVCEEMLFRGAILSGLRPRLGPWFSIVAVGLLFGLFHLSIYRIVPTALLGMVLTYVAVRSGSIFPGMLLHALNNSLAVCIATGYVPGFLKTRITSIEETGLPMAYVFIALVVLAAGAALLEWSKNRDSNHF